jgi:hypothetical protein
MSLIRLALKAERWNVELWNVERWNVERLNVERWNVERYFLPFLVIYQYFELICLV